MHYIGKVMLVILVLSGVCLAGCKTVQVGEKKVKDCDFTVLKEEEIPEELMEIIKEKETEPFQLSYADNGELYLAEGYGQQNGGGYSIAVQELYETKNSICFDTSLSGPKAKKQTKGTTYPFIVVKMEYIEKEVIYQ